MIFKFCETFPSKIHINAMNGKLMYNKNIINFNLENFIGLKYTFKLY